MLDGSTASTYIKTGDKVKVITNVIHFKGSQNEFNSIGYEGIVNDVWDKCEVDPHCCCAELAFDAPIQVIFNNNTGNWTANYAISELKIIK